MMGRWRERFSLRRRSSAPSVPLEASGRAAMVSASGEGAVAVGGNAATVVAGSHNTVVVLQSAPDALGAISLVF